MESSEFKLVKHLTGVAFSMPRISVKIMLLFEDLKID